VGPAPTVTPTRIVSIIGRKNAGKTTLTVALAGELARRKLRVMTIKHTHHAVDVDRAGTDSWRHFQEGGAERTLLVSPDHRTLFERSADDLDPIGLARRYLAGADMILVEGFKEGPLPKIEVFRPAAARSPAERRPFYDPAIPNAERWIALLTDDPELHADIPVLHFTDTMWLPRLALLAIERALPLGDATLGGTP
jgi:molybdopterin-guanine dinucleotide biosynthesis adapter protein